MLMFKFRVSSKPMVYRVWARAVLERSILWPQMRRVCCDELCIAILPPNTVKGWACVYNRLLRGFVCRVYQSFWAALRWGLVDVFHFNWHMLFFFFFFFLTRNVHFIPKILFSQQKPTQIAFLACSPCVNRSVCCQPKPNVSPSLLLALHKNYETWPPLFKVKCINLQ